MIKTHTFRGKRFQIKDQSECEEFMFGECFKSPLAAFCWIKIPIDGDTRMDCDTVLHEALHACTELDEEAVEETATDIARLLWRLGWRKDVDNYYQ